MVEKERHPDVASFLKERIAEIQKRNGRVSMRSLSVKSEMSPGRFADLVFGRRALTEYYAEKLANGLKLGRQERDALYSLISSPSRKSKPSRILSERELSVMTGWENFAILNLLQTANCESSVEKIAERLALSLERTQECLHVLNDLGLIARTEEGYERSSAYVTTSWEIPSAALKEAHEKVLKKSIEVLKSTHPDCRSYSSLTMAIDMNKLDSAKDMINKFRKKFNRYFETGKKTEVYNLSIQFFPYTDVAGVSHDQKN